MEISGINLTSPWSLIFFISVYAVGYYFVEIIWGKSYFCRKEMNDGNHISIKAMHYLFWGLPVSIGFAYFFLTKSDLNSLNNLLNSIGNLVVYFSPDKKINWSAYWLIISINFFYFVVFFLALSKAAFHLPNKIGKIYLKNKDYFDTKGLHFFGIFVVFGGLLFFIVTYTLGFKEFLQHNYISKYIYIIEKIVYYMFILIPIGSYFLFKRIGLKNRFFSTLGISIITFSIYLFFASIYGIRFNFINAIISYVFDGDLIGSVATWVYYLIVGIVFVGFWYIGQWIINKASNNIYNQRIIETLLKFHDSIKKSDKTH